MQRNNHYNVAFPKLFQLLWEERMAMSQVQQQPVATVEGFLKGELKLLFGRGFTSDGGRLGVGDANRD